MRVLATIAALLLMATVSTIFLFGEDTVPRHSLVESPPDEVSSEPGASPVTAPGKDVAARRVSPDPNAIIGLMMLLGAQRGR